MITLFQSAFCPLFKRKMVLTSLIFCYFVGKWLQSEVSSINTVIWQSDRAITGFIAHTFKISELIVRVCSMIRKKCHYPVYIVQLLLLMMIACNCRLLSNLNAAPYHNVSWNLTEIICLPANEYCLSLILWNVTDFSRLS